MFGIIHAVGNARYNSAQKLAKALQTYLKEKSLSVTILLDNSPNQSAQELELVFAIGGDGTIMRAMKQFSAPVFGINAGTIGFLAGAEPDDWQSAVDRVLAGDYVVEDRQAFTVTVRNAAGEVRYCIDTVANEVAIEHARYPVQQLEIKVANEPLWQPLFARGVLVATATGSNAQNFAAGGELLFPTSTDAVITPINPQLASYRSFALPHVAAGQSIEILVSEGKYGGDQLQLSADGTSYTPLVSGDVVTVCATNNPLKLATFGLPQYFRALRKKGIAAGAA